MLNHGLFQELVTQYLNYKGSPGDGACCCSNGISQYSGFIWTKSINSRGWTTNDNLCAGTTCCRQKGNCSKQGYDTYVCRSCNWCARVCGGRVMRVQNVL